MRIKAIDLLTVAAAITVTSGAHAYNSPPACPNQPTLQQCQDPNFMYGTCGQPFLDDARTNPDAICNVLLEEAALNTAAGLNETPVVVPQVVDAGGTVHGDGSDANIDDARVAPRIDEAVDTVGGQSLAQSGGGMLLDPMMMYAIQMGDDPFPDYPLPDPQPTPDPEPEPEPEPEPDPTPAPPATAHDAPVSGCADFARDKYLGYTTFDDAATAVAEDHRAVFQLAYGPVTDARAFGSRAMAGMAIEGTDGRPFTVPFPAGLQPKNTWFTVEFAPDADYSIDPHVDPGDGSLIRLKGVVLGDAGLEAAVDAGRSHHVEDFAWHWNMSQSLAGELDERMIDRERAQASFAELLAKRALAVDASLPALRDAMRTVFGEALDDCIGDIDITHLPPGVDPFEDCMQDMDMDALMAPHRSAVNARLAAYDAEIRSRLQAAQADGCVNPNAATLCDWSPRRFAQRMKDTVGAMRQRDYEKCLDYTGDDFAAMADYTFTNPIHGNVLWTRRDYTTSPAAVDLFMNRRDYWRDILADELDEVLEADGGPAGSPRMAGGASDAVEMGNSLFGAGYSYDMSWQFFGLENGLCNLDASFDASFAADVSVMGQDQSLVMADAHAGFDQMDLDLEIFGQTLIDLHQPIIDQETYTLVDGEDVSEQTIADHTFRFTILGIPMSLEVGASGKLGVARRLAAEIDRGGAECDEVSATLVGRLEPIVEFDGYAEAGVDFFIAKAGVKGELALVHVRLPFDLSLGVAAEDGNVANLALTIAGHLEAAVRVLDGKLSLFAEVGIGPFSESAEKTFFSWSGIETEWDVLDFDVDVPLSAMLSWFQNPI